MFINALKKASLAALLALVVLVVSFYGFYALCVIGLWAVTNYPVALAIVAFWVIAIGGGLGMAKLCERGGLVD